MIFARTIRFASIVSFLLCGRASYAQAAADMLTTTTQPVAESFRATAPLSPFRELSPAEQPETCGKVCATRESLMKWRSQGLWPIRIEYEDGTQYWGEITKIGEDSFELWNRDTNETVILSYVGIQTVELVKAYGALGKYSLADALRSLRRRPQLQLSPEQASYKLAVEKLGVDLHRFVHCDLVNGKKLTGNITDIQEDGFTLENLFFTKFIPYADLKSSPRGVAAVGTRIGQGFMWAGVALLVPFWFLFWDGC